MLSNHKFVSVRVKADRFSGYISGTSKRDRPRSCGSWSLKFYAFILVKRGQKEHILVEIELKVRVSDPEGMKKKLSGLGIYECAYEKDDTYWLAGGPEGQNAGGTRQPSLPAPGLRIRRETNTGTNGKVTAFNLVTYKIRDLQDGVEINDEREFEVSGVENFEDLLRRLGLKPETAKHKRGWAWRLGRSETAAGPDTEIRAELSDVKNLGWFLELEILTPRGDEKTVAWCREKLLFFLEKLEIPREKIETRPYTEMLKAIRQGRDEKPGAGQLR
jgi:adenylate cyclase class 2